MTTDERFLSTQARLGGQADRSLGNERKEKVEFDLTFLFPRELRLLVERNGMQIESIYGNYDGSAVKSESPRLIACCTLLPSTGTPGEG